MTFCQQPLRRYCNQLVPLQHQLPAQAYIRSQHHRLQFSGSILDLQLKACSKYQSCLQLFWAAYQPHIKGPAVTGLSTASEVTCPASVVV